VPSFESLVVGSWIRLLGSEGRLMVGSDGHRPPGTPAALSSWFDAGSLCHRRRQQDSDCTGLVC